MNTKIGKVIANEIISLIKRVFHSDFYVEQNHGYEEFLIYRLSYPHTYESWGDIDLVFSLNENTLSCTLSKKLMIFTKTEISEFASFCFRKFSTGFKYAEIGAIEFGLDFITYDFVINLKSDNELAKIV